VPPQATAAADACAHKIGTGFKYACHSQPIKAGPANAQYGASF